MTIASHTIVKNGMPFIGKVLRQAAPFMDKMFITISQNTNDGTYEEVMKFINELKKVVELGWEGVSNPAELTQVRQFQVDRTKQDWILFLDDDDYWLPDQLEGCLNELSKSDDILAYSVGCFQLMDFGSFDSSWNNKSFSKFLKNFDGLHYKGAWPKDLPMDVKGAALYHKTHSLVKTLPYRFYHLSYLKPYSFRSENWAKRFAFKKGKAVNLEKPLVI